MAKGSGRRHRGGKRKRQRKNRCTTCTGSKVTPGSEEPCATCKGTGKTISYR